MTARIQVASSQLQFTRDGHTLIVAESDAIVLVATHGERRHRIAMPGVCAIAGVADQAWAIGTTGTAGVLLRWASDGRRLGEHPVVADSSAWLVPAMIGAPAAVWHGRESAIVVDDLGTLATVPLAAADDVIPIAGRRIARCLGSRLVLPSGAHCTLPHGARIAGGCVVFDGAGVGLVTEGPHGRDLVVVAIASGVVTQRAAIVAGPIRIAARRGLAVVQHAPRRFALVDLKFGRMVGQVVSDDDAHDFAIDHDGMQLAIRLADGEVALTLLRQAPSPLVQVSVAEPTVDDAPVPASAPALASPPAPQVQAPLPEVSVSALAPRASRPPIDRDTAVAALDQELHGVMLRAALAISTAWDTRQLAFGNEGHHPFEHEVAGLIGRNAGFAAEYVETARTALADHEAVAAELDTPIAELVAELGLSEVARAIVFVIAAPSIDGRIAQLYRILGNETGRVLVDELVVQQLLADRFGPHDIAAELHPGAPLIRFGVVGVEPGRRRPFAALEVHPIVVSRLRAEPLAMPYGIARVARHGLATLDLA
ncbi:MAG TPA: hypothetical protein VFQ65_22655, partial [Kofleriaceae bacterium]|nr:hypothetical protein [Kofleriaceae bacterium]